VCVCVTRKTPYDYNIKLRRSGPETMLIETKSQIRRWRPAVCSGGGIVYTSACVCMCVRERGFNIKLIDIDVLGGRGM